MYIWKHRVHPATCETVIGPNLLSFILLMDCNIASLVRDNTFIHPGFMLATP
jgi:hypothetical protein